jgi:putative redox protein
MSDGDTVLGHVRSRGGEQHWATSIRSGRNEVIADEGAHGGGQDAGLSPFALMLAGLAACTNITLRMYADRKGWPLTSVEVECTMYRDGSDPSTDHIERALAFEGDLDDDQRARLADIAERTPVTLVVKRGTPVHTTLR